MSAKRLGYELQRGEATGPFSLWSPVLNAVWPPCSGATMLIALRALAMLIEDGRVGSFVETEELGALVGIAPSRFVHAVELAKGFGLVTGEDQVLYVPLRVHGPEPELWNSLPLVSQRLAQRVIAGMGRGPWPHTQPQ